jgi:hypothetical protein
MPVQGGKTISDIDLGIQGDDTGENISAKNPYYCELTELYWAWKNLKNVDYIGLCHYRRYFKFSSLPFRGLITCPVDKFLTMQDTTFNLNKHLGKHDIVMAKPSIYPHSLVVDYALWHHSDDYRLLKGIVHDSFPKYYDSFCYVMERNNKLPHYNMFITRWGVFDDYCKWLFAVLGEVEKSIDYAKYTAYQARVLAFMAERLLCVYVFKNNLNVKYYPLIMLSDKEEVQSSSIKNMIFIYKANISFLFSQPLKYWFRRPSRL